VDKFECKHCGKCCLMLPCVFARVKFDSHMGDVCPALDNRNGLWFCTLIETDTEAREVLMDGYCDDPDKVDDKPSFNAFDIAKEYFPDASDEEIEHIIWSHTGFPDFWWIPEDGWTSLQCLRTQLQRFKNDRDSQEISVS